MNRRVTVLVVAVLCCTVVWLGAVRAAPEQVEQETVRGRLDRMDREIAELKNRLDSLRADEHLRRTASLEEIVRAMRWREFERAETSWGRSVNAKLKWRRVGDSLEVRVEVVPLDSPEEISKRLGKESLLKDNPLEILLSPAPINEFRPDLHPLNDHGDYLGLVGDLSGLVNSKLQRSGHVLLVTRKDSASGEDRYWLQPNWVTIWEEGSTETKATGTTLIPVHPSALPRYLPYSGSGAVIEMRASIPLKNPAGADTRPTQ